MKGTAIEAEIIILATSERRLSIDLQQAARQDL
jgi:hypothetical protein